MNHGRFGIMRLTGKLLKCGLNQKGYRVTRLCGYGGVSKMHKIHRLVAVAFIPNPQNKPTVNHKDGNKLNNRIENLEWATYFENNEHAYDTGLTRFSFRGYRENHPSCKVSNVVFLKIVELYKTGLYSQNDLAKKFGVSQMTVSKYVRSDLKSKNITNKIL